MNVRKWKILLIYPPFLEARIPTDEIRALPMGLYHVAAAMKADGHEVALLNLNDHRPDMIQVMETIRNFQPNVVGFSILNANRWGGIDLARRIKALDAGIVTVFGGIGASTLWEHLLTHFESIDYVVIGEGENAFKRLVQRLANQDGAKIDRLGGLAFRRDGRPVRTPCDPFIEDLDGLPDPSRYFTYQHLSLTRGCPADCRFCGSPGFWGRRVRWHSPACFVDQIERLVARGVSFFYFSDDTFTLRRQSVLAVCRAIVARGLAIRWAAISRVDTVDEEILRWMRRAGCIQISYGIESANAEVRRFLDKRIKIEDVKNAFAATRRCGILPRAYFIYGCPGDNEETVQEALDLMRTIKPLGAIFYILDIFPGTRLYDDYLARSGRTDDLWLAPIEDMLYFETDAAMDKEAVLAQGRMLRDGFHRLLPAFAEDIELLDDPAFYPLHADFLSRLAMTFHRGDYARIAAIPGKRHTAEKLYRRALTYAPDVRAFLGLGMLNQERGDYAAAAKILQRGLGQYPDDAALQTCAALNDMNQGAYGQALERLRQLDETPQIRQWIKDCQAAVDS
jgi:anaerobic magnesium-protoporphyrin IX monomethyl ester cyclase